MVQEAVRNDPDHDGAVAEPACGASVQMSIPVGPLLSRQLLLIQSRTKLPLVQVQTSFCVREKKENKSLINVCCVVDDFVTTSVANGLCMRNNGLLAEKEIA